MGSELPIRTTQLGNGLRLVTEQLPHIRSIALGLCFKVGSRDDPPGLAGLAHFIEHMVFKGTAELDARSISIAAESSGAELNAFTDKELSCYYGRFPADQQEPVTRLLAEIVSRPAFDPAELAKEKGVVVEEIRSMDEDPDAKATSLLLEAFYGTHPMGEPVVGTVDSVERMDPERLRSFFDGCYHSGSGVAVAAGDVRHEALAETLSRAVETWPARENPPRTRPESVPVATRTGRRPDLTQIYACLARPTFSCVDERRYALSVLNTAFGGGISSRLFQRLREDEGLVYSVSSFTELYGDSGLLGIYFVAERSKAERCLAVLREEIDQLQRAKLDEEEFLRARNMTRSSVLLSLESATNRMMRLARMYHMLGQLVTIDETAGAYDRLRLKDCNDLVEELAAGGYYAGMVGPLTQEESDRLKL